MSNRPQMESDSVFKNNIYPSIGHVNFNTIVDLVASVSASTGHTRFSSTVLIKSNAWPDHLLTPEPRARRRCLLYARVPRAFTTRNYRSLFIELNRVAASRRHPVGILTLSGRKLPLLSPTLYYHSQLN